MNSIDANLIKNGTIDDWVVVNVPEKNVSDLISRQAAIDALAENKEMINAVLDSLTFDYNTRRNLEQRRGQVNEDIETIKELPTTEPKCAGWIPCKKQMPKPNEVVGDVAKYYLVQTEYGDMMVACYNAEGDERWWEQMYHFKPIEDEIVAWMELPEEYKEGGEDELTD